MNRAISSNMPMTGLHTITLYDVSTRRAQTLERGILSMIRSGESISNERGYRDMMRRFRSLFAERELIRKNIIALEGRVAIIKRLRNDTTYTGTITRGAVGTSSATPGAADSQLGAKVYRKTVASYDTDQETSAALVIVSFFYAANDFVNSNINEFGTFIDGTDTANSGQLFTRVVFSETINKTSAKSLTVDSQYQVTSA